MRQWERSAEQASGRRRGVNRQRLGQRAGARQGLAATPRHANGGKGAGGLQARGGGQRHGRGVIKNPSMGGGGAGTKARRRVG
jgi:hypothetical protein